ncbi:MaoC family dehydratase [Sneathiella marina]|uniref:MaoC family dehydratase n=1 Tax=Sneathiella marina TaxID=2950108 RepID=A0ABY4W2U0_9PROT|nr:MaoC family dehydratase [Sneathiella marina]USG61512.1 MaoC family dehydratase [Sneathiella marina]
MTAQLQFNEIQTGEIITGRPFTVTRETIQAFADASLDYNPLHFDDKYMENTFGKTSFEGVIMHGMQNFALISRTLTDWLLPKGGYHRRLETRWLKPVQLGHTITAKATLTEKKQTDKGFWVLFEIEVTNQLDGLVATGNAMAEFLDVIPGQPE